MSFVLRRPFLSPSFLTSTRPFCTSKTIKVEHKGKGAVRTLPSAALFNPLLLPDKFTLCQHEAKVQLQSLFDNINVDLKSEECGFFLRPEIELFPIVRCQRLIDRFFFACYISRLGSKEMVEYNKMMRKRTRLGSWQVLWFSLKHRLLTNKSLSTKDVLTGVPRMVEVLSQHLRLNKLSDLVKKGMVSKEAAEAVHSRLIKLSAKQRELLRLTKDDVCYSDASDMEESTRVNLVTERSEDGRLFLDFYVQCLMQYKKSQSCAVIEGGRKVNNKSARDIQLPKDYGYSIPRSVYVVLRLSQQLKPEMSKDLVITAFNYVVCP